MISSTWLLRQIDLLFKISVVMIVFATTVMVIQPSQAKGNQDVTLFEDGMALAAQHVNGRYEDLRNQLRQAQEEIARLQGELQTAESDLTAAQAAIALRDARIAELNTTVTDLSGQVATLKARVAELESQQPAPPAPTGDLWWQQTDPARHPDHMLLAHYVPWMPAVVENQPMAIDYWARNWLTVGGESGQHASYGGRIRNAPQHGAPYSDASWRRDGAEAEIRTASKFGINGFFVDLVGTSTSHSHWLAIQALLDAAPAVSGFRVVPMLDVNGNTVAGTSDSTLAAHINRFLDRPSAWRLSDGRYVVGIFKAEGLENTRWASLLKAFEVLGKRVALVGAFNDVGKIPTYTNLYGAGAWSPGADPAVLQGVSSDVAGTRARGQRVLLPALGQNVRPSAGWYDEPRGLGALATSWARIIASTTSSSIPIVQMVTWNDYAEGSAFGPSRASGSAALAYNAWQAEKWRTGATPRILKDVAFVSHRDQLLGATITGGQTKLMTQNTSRSQRTESKDEVEIRTILTTSATVRAEVGGQVSTFVAPAGESVTYVAARAGSVRVTLSTGLVVESPIVIRSKSGNQDRSWIHVWSDEPSRTWDPTPAA